MEKDILEAKKEEMQQELAKGGQLLAQSQKQIADIQMKMQRIQGAIALLDELLAEEPQGEVK